MLSKEEVNTFGEEPPAYDVVASSPSSALQEENNYHQEMNEVLKAEIALLKAKQGQLIETQALLRQQLSLIAYQLQLTEESKKIIQANFNHLQENYKLLQRKNYSLIEWVEKSAVNEEQSWLYLEAYQACALSVADIPEISSLHLKMQDLERCLHQQNQIISTEVEKQVSEKTNQIAALFEQMLQGDAFGKLTGDLEDKFSAIIKKEHDALQLELEKIPVYDEVTLEYLDAKTKKLVDVKKIRSDEKARLFYDTSYTVFWAKITGFLSLLSELVEKKAGFKEKAVDVSSSVLSSLIGGIPMVGSFLETLSAFALKEAGGFIIDYFDGKKSSNILELIQNPEHAKKIAELFARSLTFHYQAEMQSWDVQTIKTTATRFSNQIYELSTKGIIYECHDLPVQEKVHTFLNALESAGTKEKTYELTPTSKAKLQKTSEKSIKTTVQEGTQTIRKKIATQEFQVKHASVHLEGVRRQNSGLLEETSKQKEQIKKLEAELTSLRKESILHYEEIDSLKREMGGLREIVANALTPPLEASIPTPPQTPKSKTSFFNKKVEKKDTKEQRLSYSKYPEK